MSSTAGLRDSLCHRLRETGDGETGKGLAHRVIDGRNAKRRRMDVPVLLLVETEALAT